jgi:hypothetical protein
MPAAEDDDLEVLPDDDLEAVLEEVSGEAEAAPVAPPAPPIPPAPAAPAAGAAAPRPARAAATAARTAAPAPEPEPILESDAPDLLGDPGEEVLGPRDLVPDLGAGDLEVEVAAPPAEFDGTLPGGENEIELDPSDLEGLGDVDLGSAGDFAAGVDGEPMIGGAAEFSEGDFEAPAAEAEEDPNAKTQPDQGDAAAAPAARAAGEVDLFAEGGADLSLFGDDGEEGR